MSIKHAVDTRIIEETPEWVVCESICIDGCGYIGRSVGGVAAHDETHTTIRRGEPGVRHRVIVMAAVDRSTVCTLH